MRLILFLAAVALLIPVAAVAQESEKLKIESAWARASLTPRSPVAAYVSIHNTGADADRLVAVRTEVSKRSMVHNQVTRDGISRMRPIDGVAVPGGGKFVMKPGGHHIMLMGLETPLKKGDSFPLTLVFERAGEMTVRVEVLGATAKGPETDR
jgi:copper(I)-binding protein